MNILFYNKIEEKKFEILFWIFFGLILEAT